MSAPTIEPTESILPTDARTTPVTNPKGISSVQLAAIRTLGGLLDDLEKVRIANGNRIAAHERTHGGSLPHLDEIQAGLRHLEHQAELELVRAWRKHPLAAWAKEQRGVGEKSIARLVAVVGDPGERPNVAKLWAYCGFGDPARIRIPRNATQEQLLARGNPRAKKQAWLIATSMLKAGNREVYDAARAKYAAVEISDGQKHARAIRATAKAFLRDLWLVSRDHRTNDAHGSYETGGEPE